MVQLGPDNGTDGWKFCSGYHTDSKSIIGFSHTHLSGTGASEMGDVLFMPVVGNVLSMPKGKRSGVRLPIFFFQ
jgi:putative alpha-1,2-mannosidase